MLPRNNQEHCYINVEWKWNVPNIQCVYSTGSTIYARYLGEKPRA